MLNGELDTQIEAVVHSTIVIYILCQNWTLYLFHVKNKIK